METSAVYSLTNIPILLDSSCIFPILLKEGRLNRECFDIL